MKVVLQKHIHQNLSFLKDKNLLIAISGGIDSTVLADLFYQLNFSISLAHCNFMLRGKESKKDEQFVKELGDKLKIPTFIIQFETKKYALENGISTQMAARDLRYNWFQKITQQNNIDFILTAHQKDDVIETFIINLTRGTGLDGLTGIPEINGNIIRPLLPFDRNDILIYATKNKLQWREDQSNSSLRYVRNKIRHKIVPVLKELNPSLLDTFQNTLENLKESKQIIKDCIQNVKQKVITTHNNEMHFNISELKKLSNPKIYLYELLKEYGFTAWNDVDDLLNAQSGKQLLSKTHRLLKDRAVLILTNLSNTEESGVFEIKENTSKITFPIQLEFEKIEIPFDTKKHQNKIFNELISTETNTISIDFNKLTYPLILRKKRKGDYFYPIGLGGKKKISKFFKDQKLSLIDKENMWLLCSDNDIIWIVGKRLDDRFKVSKSTSTILKIKL
ncbi:tRNA(Ile)-lysidine synthetase [Lutibacter profundi]|uniref:tRNA(Ile)-lysidine synthase n=1 Tax=Lutibacter profundi TaxID=1622118 RepID=A0A0X8G7W1_9FLAO|nr:tRNA lysidine(34) synthetase TilS [Lutibacter profundi]AMC11700.1 tRNA(Ile)-lysidine synthetase [Lutibacter profundi]